MLSTDKTLQECEYKTTYNELLNDIHRQGVIATRGQWRTGILTQLRIKNPGYLTYLPIYFLFVHNIFWNNGSNTPKKVGVHRIESNKLKPDGKKGFVTFVVYPKPMNKEFYNVQANCILRLKNFKCTKKIVVCGNDEGIEDFCKKYNLIHEPEIKTNELSKLGMVSDIFQKGLNHTIPGDYCCYLNSDILFNKNFDKTLLTFKEQFPKKRDFLLIGRRMNTIHNNELLTDKNYKKTVSSWKKELDRSNALDYFVFTHDTYEYIPDLTVARWWWDDWLACSASMRNDVFDLTKSVNAYHLLSNYIKPELEKKFNRKFGVKERDELEQLDAKHSEDVRYNKGIGWPGDCELSSNYLSYSYKDDILFIRKREKQLKYNKG